MRNIIVLLILSVVATTSFAQETALTLEECINYALEHNQEYLNANLETEISDYVVKETISDGLPQLNGNLDLTYNIKIQTSFIQDFISPAVYDVLQGEGLLEPGPTPDPQFFPVQFGTKYAGNANISLNQMVFDGSFFVGLRAARTFAELSYKDRIRTKIDVVEGVSKAYYLAMVNQERQELILKNYQRLDTLLQETQALYENGFAEKIDVNRIQVQFNNIRVQQDNIARSVALSKALLKFQMGMSPKDDLELKDTIDELIFQEVPAQVFQDFDYNRRIEMSYLQTNIELNQLDIKNVKMGYLPDIDLYGALGATAGTQSSGELFKPGTNWFDYSAVGVRMQLPIFDGLRKSHQIQQRKIKALQLENSREQLQNSIDVEIQQSATNYQLAVDNLKAQLENMDLAEEVYNVAKIKYEEGVGSSIEVTNADADYKESQTNYYNALYDALIAKVELQKAYGVLIEQN
ncbi:TolC family protein [Fulvivirga sedimenti]|uniref:TolC family protein n=1 Tax=Fulvivirga sedimenti TaxID=2879465 RepID=A0A9X1HNH8_9BACT|nr:TolC family protein [Fulvivirga sedimenti]MCA6075418.1 TolC family protein [Fulvivirga sedimenti]MCA6076595.1 TolC family protein [Fulvivirga sedimenti]MCA6077723.1 TolC family protein [Fulvivirga sedimenti]